MEFRTLSVDELQLWSEFNREVFNKETGQDQGDSCLRMYNNDPWKEYSNILVAVDKGSIVSTVGTFFRTMMLGGVQIKMGAIGAVCTKPEYRGRGLASNLLNLAVDSMHESGIQISMLTSGIWSFYERLGWKNIDWNWKVTDFKVDNSNLEELTVRPINSKDISSIKLIYAQQIQRFNGPIVRSDEYWEQWVQIENKPCWVATNKAGNVLAYLWLYVREEDHYICVIEHGVSKTDVSIIDKMINQICSSYGWESCRLRAQSGVDLGFEISDTATYPGLMYRLIKPIRILNEHITTTEQLINFLNLKNKLKSSDYLNLDHDNV